ncbi:SulP family sulfate permease [Saccharothrix ecbatanensis]|uniref:SulP family sulfate permease n=2 Tax=Saccharothrix ecbatanensis TaxID=1105145 RepID=A0A7W9HK50_9PSEU|nr:SulP family sulfate permease [Saccharothrix ecbatanensis]
MAAAVLAGVSPAHGLYACVAGPIAGGSLTSTRLMVITTTGAAALAAGSAVADLDPADRPDALFLLTVLAGLVAVVAGLARLGRHTRFVSHSVMLGFLTGVSVNIVAGQLPDLVGVEASGSTPIAKAVAVFGHLSRVDVPSLLVGVAALAMLVGSSRTRFGVVGAVVALVVPTAVVAFASIDVALVHDGGAIESGVPLPALPDLSLLSLDLVVGAVAVAAIVLVQGAGVSEATPNRDGSRADTSRDFIAQGVANIASGLFRGQPVGGSVGQTALNVAVGARSRWGSIWAGVWMLVVLVAFSGLVGLVAMPTLAAVLVFAAIGSLRPRELLTVLRTGRVSRIAMITTFLATLFLPVAAAIGVGVALSLLLQLNREALDLAVVRLVPRDDGRFVERPAPTTLAGHRVIVLDVYGSLFYAGAQTLRARLPDPTGARSPVVVLRLRGRTSFGATFFVVVADYARRLDAVGGRLYVSGLRPDVAAAFRRAGGALLSGPVRVFESTDLIGQSTLAAYRDAEAWLVEHDGRTHP